MFRISSESSRIKLRTWLLWSMAFLLPFKFKLIILLVTVYFVLWLRDRKWGTFLEDLRSNPVSLLLIGFYLLHVTGMLWTDNAEDGIFDLQVKFSLLLLPLILTDREFNTSERITTVIRAFVYGCVTAISIDLIYALITDDKNRFFYSALSKFLHPGYFALYLCFSAVVILNDLIRTRGTRLFPMPFNIIAFALICIGIILLSSKSGILILVLITAYYAWISFRSINVKHIAVVAGVIVGVAIVVSLKVPFIHERIYEVQNLLNKDASGAKVTSSVMRLQVWEAALSIIRDVPLLGTGTGDIKDTLIERYKQNGHSYVAEVRLNAHNQYLQSFAALGILGFLIYGGIFVYGLIFAYRSKNHLLFWFLLIIAIYSVVESVLEVQAGVMFFTFFIPLLYRYRYVPELSAVKVSDPPQQIIPWLRNYANVHPLRFALAAGLLLRLIAVIFSRGFGMHDDHFLVIEASQAWADGTDYDNWLPQYGGVRPDGHSFFYSGLHFIFFSILKFLGIYDPQIKMVLVRLVHALLSLGTIYFGFRIAYRMGDLRSARTVGLLLALLWFMPWLSVRNLVEVACIPFLIWGSWLMLTASDHSKRARYFLYAGMLFGVAFSIRFQTVLFIGGAGLALLFLKRLKDAVALGIGSVLVFTATQAPVDYIIWGAPFAQFTEYVLYNLDNAYNYIVGPWYNYTLLILGILVPPVSLFLFFGWIRQWKRYLILFLPVLVFLAFHSYFPNKQERFILPMVPFFVIMGIPGWNAWVDSKKRSAFFLSFIKVSWAFFWTINTFLLPFITTMYSKRARVESMTYLYPRRATIASLIMEDTNRSSAKMAPEFYLGKWIYTYELSELSGYDSLTFYMRKSGPMNFPQYALFLGDKNLDVRVERLKQYFPDMQLEATIEPGFVDKVLYWLNPKNANDVIYIYRTGVPGLKPHPPD